ncbi:hypothetical protein [Planobispora longispora]|uniref:Uncharacterized protein n=1 Tax=Planobispora longispora TaxID=28887 RepID=A0A8J3RQP4_9ACTN|nr:hypothetical protein [Planobispora longispora]BFE79560.1 hypothetical protein GCM10020093_021610 [Planobispora longispora]GIH78132.1 hypothetical protein Plo01_45610 [Planobispora longispora]
MPVILPMHVAPATLTYDGKTAWSLWMGADGLPRRVRASGPMVIAVPEGGDALVMELDIRFREWGGAHTITAPPAEEVTG